MIRQRVVDVALVLAWFTGMVATVTVVAGLVCHTWWSMPVGLVIWQIGGVCGVVCLVAMLVGFVLDETVVRSER